MSTIKNLFVTFVLYLLAGIASVIGMLGGMAIWTNGLGDKVEEKTRQLFNKES
jgi:hypothetical protein